MSNGNDQNDIESLIDNPELTEQTEKKPEAKKSTSRRFFKKVIKKAWNNTFLPGIVNSEQRKATGFVEYFLGFPAKKNRGAKIAYFLLLDFLFLPLKNTLKLLTEFLPNAIMRGVRFVSGSLPDIIGDKHTNKFQKGAAVIGSIAAAIVLGIAAALYFVGRAITSPVASADTFFNRRDESNQPTNLGRFLGGLSFFCSVVALMTCAGLIVAFPPFGIAAVLGAVSAKVTAGAFYHSLKKPEVQEENSPASKPQQMHFKSIDQDRLDVIDQNSFTPGNRFFSSPALKTQENNDQAQDLPNNKPQDNRLSYKKNQ